MTTPTNHTPAIAGGTPAKTVPYTRAPRYGEAELEQLREALEQGTLFGPQGRKVKELEAAMAEHVGLRHAVACSSGTAAIHAALIAAEISPGDEVITAPITDMGSVIPILYQGAVPVFADVEPDTGCLAAASVEERFTPRTVAVLAVHLGGNPCDLDALRAVCDPRGVMLIEDCAQAWGATYRGKPVGTFGAMGCYSLNEFKHISCGDGGLIVTDDDDLARRLRLAVDKCYDRAAGAGMRDPTFLGNNYRMTELQAAVALAQLPKLPGIVASRRTWCEELTRRIGDLPGVHPAAVTPGADGSWWFYMLRVDGDADAFAEALRAEGLPAGAHYIGRCVYEYPVFTGHSAFARGGHAYQGRDYGHGLCPNAEAFLDHVVTLAVNEGYTDTDLDETACAIQKVARAGV
jgi:dTDP-4-amino-4,6-dideoxygalactose transaminase